MIGFSPKSVTYTESNPSSVASYITTVKIDGESDQVITTPSQGVSTIVPLGANVFTEAMVQAHKQVTLFGQEVGPSGETTDPVQIGGTLNILELPDGFEAATVQV